MIGKIKLTIDQLKNYLGTGLKLYVEGEIRTLHGLFQSNLGFRAETEYSFMQSSEIKLICYRLSDLDKFIPELGFVPLNELKSIDGEYYLEMESNETLFLSDLCNLGLYEITRINELLQKLFQWHFWLFGDEYFDQGLVIDKLKLGKEVTNG